MKTAGESINDHITTFTDKDKDSQALVEHLRGVRKKVEAARRRVEEAERFIAELIQDLVPNDAILGEEHETYYSTDQGEFTMTQFIAFCSRGDDGWRLRVRSPETAGEGGKTPLGIPLVNAGSRTLLHCAGNEDKLEMLVQAILRNAVEDLSLASHAEEQPSPRQRRNAPLN